MRGVTITLLLLGVVAYTQARLLELSDMMNVTGTGAFCVDERGMPRRFLNNTKDIVENCGGLDVLRLGGTIRSTVASTVEFGVTIGKGKPGKLEAANMAIIFVIPTEVGENEFKVPDNVLTKISDVLKSLTDCQDGPQVFLTLFALKSGTSGELMFEPFVSQDFVIAQCLEKERLTKVRLATSFVKSERFDVIVKLAGNTPFIQVNEIISELTANVDGAALPALDPPTTADAVTKPYWPRGPLVYMTRRKIDTCNRKSADVRADDEVLAFYPLDQALAIGTNHPFTIDKAVEFGKGKGGKCLFCGNVTIVVVYDFLGRDARGRDDCTNPGFSTSQVFINCDALKLATPDFKEYEKNDVIPFYKDQGATMWVRKCYPGKGIKLINMDEGRMGHTFWRFVDPRKHFEMTEVARMMIVAEYFNSLDFCDNFLTKDEAVNKVKAIVPEQCKNAFLEKMNNTAAATPRGTLEKPDFDITEVLDNNCGDALEKPKIAEFFEESRESNEMTEDLSKGLCPDAGFRPKDAFSDDSSDRNRADRSKMISKKAAYEAIMNGGRRCEDAPEKDMCGYRVLTMLMSSAQRFLANMDLYEDHIDEEEFSTNFDQVKHALGQLANREDVEFAKKCARPDFFKPVDTTPTVWKTTPDGIMRGHYNMFLNKWCYNKMAQWSCPGCDRPDASKVDPYNGKGGYSGDGGEGGALAPSPAPSTPPKRR